VKKEEENGSPVKKEEQVTEEEEVEDPNPVRVKGTILVLEGVGPDVNFIKIKNFFKQHGAVAYVDVDKETKKAFIRFQQEDEAVSVLKTACITKNKDENENGSGDTKVKEENGSDTAKVKEENGSAEKVDTEPMKEEEEKSVPQTDAADEKDDDEDESSPCILISGTKYKASVLTGEDEVTHWRNVNKAKKNAALNPKNDSHNRNSGRSRGRGFKRGGKGYQGRNDRSDFKRKTRSSEDSSSNNNKKVRAD
jgi:hypothetical protein